MFICNHASMTSLLHVLSFFLSLLLNQYPYKHLKTRLHFFLFLWYHRLLILHHHHKPMGPFLSSPKLISLTFLISYSITKLNNSGDKASPVSNFSQWEKRRQKFPIFTLLWVPSEHVFINFSITHIILIHWHNNPLTARNCQPAVSTTFRCLMTVCEWCVVNITILHNGLRIQIFSYPNFSRCHISRKFVPPLGIKPPLYLRYGAHYFL